MKIHFICRGNVLRSLIAEAYVASLQLRHINVISSGTNVNWDDPQEKDYFANTMAILARHSIEHHAKPGPDQLTVQRLDGHRDVVVCMNQRVIDEASALVELPNNVINWNITDIGEGDRTNADNREAYEEEIYQEIVAQVDGLVRTLTC